MDKPMTLLGALFAFIGGINVFLTGGACPVCYAELAGGTALAGYGLIRKTDSCPLQKDKQTTNTGNAEHACNKTNEKKTKTKK